MPLPRALRRPALRALRRRRPALPALAALLALLGAALVATGAPASAAVTRDGLSEAGALASCWDVKQTDPSATDGVYWLYTPDLQYPQQFWCDMTTDGGGWVLVGRGRDNWSFLPEGQGTVAQVASPSSGPSAFAPKALPTVTVNALLAGTDVKDLPDGVRIRRAKDSAGSTWQEVRVRPSGMRDWRWTVGGGYWLTSISFDGATSTSASNTFAYACPSASYSCLDTRRTTNNNNRPGFGYGSGVSAGTASSTNYLWGKATTGYAVPFAQVFLRPTVRWADLTITPVGTGLPGSTNRVLFDNFARSQPAGVSGLANGLTTERDTEVRAFARIGSTMYVGGNFARVDEYGTTTTSTAQPYLAAFDVGTGAWVSTFRPALDGKVNALAALPNGTLAVGGEFSTVDGTTQGGLVALNAVTGQIASAPRFGLQKRTTSNGTTTVTRGTVTALGLHETTLYIGGSFTHLSAGTSTAMSGYVYAKRAGRVDLSTNKPDSRWNPAFDGTPIFVLPSEAGDRVYFGGFMSTMNDGATTALRFVAVTTSTPAAKVAGLHDWVSSSPSKVQYQQTAVESGGRFVLGGAEHSFHFYDRSDLTFVRGNVTNANPGGGGDFQASVVDNGVAYGSCHCILSYSYGGRTQWSTIDAYDDIDNLRYVGAYDLTTGHDVTSFTPWIATRAVRGPWALTVDADGCLWVGGDLTKTRRRSDSAWQSSGGFGVFCRNDHTAPSVPTSLHSSVSPDTTTVTVAWTGSGDDRAAALRYTLFRDDVPVATVSGWKVAFPAASAAGVYVVRAFDKAGNVSASTSPLTVAPV